MAETQELAKVMGIFEVKGNMYFGTALAAELCGGEVVIIAPSKEILDKAWKKLKSGPVDFSRVAEVAMCGTEQTEKISD